MHLWDRGHQLKIRGRVRGWELVDLAYCTKDPHVYLYWLISINKLAGLTGMSRGWETVAIGIRETASMPKWGPESLQKSLWRVLQLGGLGHGSLELGNYWTDPCNFQRTITSFLRSDLCVPLLGAISHPRRVLWSMSLRSPLHTGGLKTRLGIKSQIRFQCSCLQVSSTCSHCGPGSVW